MPSYFAQMGIWAYPMLLTAILLLVQIARAFIAPGTRSSRGGGGVADSILPLGVLNALLGFLGTAVGISLAADAIQNATSISPPVIMGGLKVALSTTIFGLLLLILALVAWMALGLWEGRQNPE